MICWCKPITRDTAQQPGKVRAVSRPVDEPLLYLLADRRRARPRLFDGLWVRLVSVPEALAAGGIHAPLT